MARRTVSGVVVVLFIESLSVYCCRILIELIGFEFCGNVLEKSRHCIGRESRNCIGWVKSLVEIISLSNNIDLEQMDMVSVSTNVTLLITIDFRTLASFPHTNIFSQDSTQQ